jgi:CHAT domain-containing protein/tetratricopeptide (TPR) repeat protein
MDEQRLQAYVGLIEQLLGCPQGQEEEILQANAALVDAGLVAEMGQVADWLESQGNSNAGWLRRFAAALVQDLGLGGESPSSQSQEDAAEFALEILQLIAQTGGDQAQVYGFFRDNLGRLNEALLLALPGLFATLIQQHDPAIIATVFDMFGNLIQQFPLGTRMLNMELAIATYEQALTVITQATLPIDWATTSMNLANAYSDRINGDRADNLEQAIAACQLALQVYTRDAFPERWAATQNNLATAYNNRINGDRADNLEQAIAAYQWALQVYTRDAFPEQWAMTQNNLANAYSDRINGDRADNLELAIAAYAQALTVMTKAAMPIEWAQTTNNLATAYSDRINGDRAENLERAIAGYEQALTVMTQATLPIEWATTTMNLATAYKNRINGDRAENIEQAIASYEQALTVRTQATLPLEWAQTTMNLANAYYSRINGDRAENLERAIAGYEQALTVTTQAAMPIEWATTTNNLATAYKNRINGDLADNIEQAIAAYEQALTVMTPTALPDDCRKTGRLLANLYSDQSRWTEASTTYQIALQAAEICYQRSDFLDSKSAELSTTADLPRRAAYACAQTGDLTQAIETLEQGRARGLSESLSRDRADLQALAQQNPTLHSQYQTIITELRNLEIEQRNPASLRTRPEIQTSLQTQTQQFQTTIAQIRQISGYEDFLKPPTFAEIEKAVTIDRPLVYLVTTPNGGMVLTVSVNAIDVLWLDDLTETKLIDLLSQTWFAAYNKSQSDRQGWEDAIASVTRQLWEPLMAPLIDHLKQHSFQQAILIPTGYLSLLPLHAAWIEAPNKPTGKRYALDDIHFTYAPNAKSLTAAQAIADRVPADSILAIDNPRNDLPNSEREVHAAVNSFSDRTVLRHDQATIAAVKQALPQAAIAHFSCHGTADLTDPLNSGLFMSDGLLSLKDIFELNLAEGDRGIRLAILSACETGMIGIENADEAVSLPTGLLQAGVAAVIASLWSVSDLSTSLLLAKFYAIWREQDIAPDLALRQAQIWLRDTTNQEKIAEFQAAIPGFPASTRMSPTTAQQLYREMAWEEGRDRAFAHPFHWAAFSYTGTCPHRLSASEDS